MRHYNKHSEISKMSREPSGPPKTEGRRTRSSGADISHHNSDKNDRHSRHGKRSSHESRRHHSTNNGENKRRGGSSNRHSEEEESVR